MPEINWRRGAGVSFLFLVRHVYDSYNLAGLDRLELALCATFNETNPPEKVFQARLPEIIFVWLNVTCEQSRGALLHIKISFSQRERSGTFPWQRQLLMLGEGDVRFMTLYFISSQFYSDSMNIKCNKNVIYSRREFCIGVQEKRIYLQNSTQKREHGTSQLLSHISINHKNNIKSVCVVVSQVSFYWILIILDYTFSYKSCKNPHTWGGRGGNTTFFLFLVVVFCKNTLQCIAPELPGGWLEKIPKLQFKSAICGTIAAWWSHQIRELDVKAVTMVRYDG